MLIYQHPESSLMNKTHQILPAGEIAKNEEAVNQFIANAWRGRSGVVFFNDSGAECLPLSPAKQRLVEKMANRILTSDTIYSK